MYCILLLYTGPDGPHSLITGPIPGLDIDGIDDSELDGKS